MKNWLVIQSNPASHPLVIDSYGVIATAAMFDTEINLVFCSDGISQLNEPVILDQLKQAKEFGLKKLFLHETTGQSISNLPTGIVSINSSTFNNLIGESDHVLNF